MRQMNYGSLYGGSIKPRDKEEEKKRIFLDNNFPIATVDNPYDPAKQREQILLKQIGYGINDTYTPPATTQAATPNTQDPMEELRRRLNIPAPEPFVNPITNPHQSQILQKWGEMTTPLAATIADVGGNVGLGMAKGIEGIMDAGATVGAWGARAIGADRAEQKIRDFIVKDHFGDDGSFSDAMVDAGSLLGNGKAGDIIRGISQGVGQMLPSVAAAIITGGGSVAGMTALGLSAGGGGVEEALSEGAGLGRATLYGAAVAGTELATEKLVGGPMAKVFGGGWLDDVTGSVLKTGWGRVAKEAVGEGVEEMTSEGLSPMLKSIYKGVDAFSEYGEKDFWKGVGKAGLTGAGTSVVFGGTVGRAMGTSGKAADVASLADDISSNAKRRMELYREGKITEGDENDRRTSRTMLADYQKLQEILQKTDATERSRLIKANNLGGVVDENGTVRPSVLASLTIEDTDSQTPTGEQNAAQSKKTPLSGAYLSPGLWRQSEKVQSDLAGISDDLKANGKEGKPVELFRGELSEAAQENYNAFKRAASKLSLQSDNKLQFALIDAPSSVSGVHRGGTVYLNTETLEDGKWARVLFEEATHFTDGTAEAADFKAFLEKEDGLFEDVAEGLLAQGNAYGFTDENVMGEKSETFNREMYAQMASRVLTSPEYVDKLVRADRTLAEKIKNRISDVAETLRSVTSKDIEVRKQLRQATKAQGLFERALEGADGKGTEVDFLFAGKNAKTADKMRLATAEKMLEGGVDSETIRKETGWHQGYDGKWRFEIDDFDSRTIENPKIERHDDDGEIYYTGELGDIFDHKLLFEAYPELKDINIVIQPTDYGVDAIYQPNSNYITLSREHFKRYTKAYEDYLNGGRKDEIAKIEQTPEFLEYEKWYDDEVADNMDPMEWLAGEKAAREKFFSSELGKRYYQLKYSKDGFTGDKFEAGWGKEAKTVLIHELQHAIQNIEGFATGTNTKDPNYDKNAGEIEGYDAGRRANMTAEERKNTRPEIDRPDAVVRRNGIYYDANSKRAQEDAVRTQIRDHLDEINQMEPVTKITFDSSKITDNIIAKKMAVEEFKNFGSQIDRQGFGIILIGKDEIGTGIGYVHTPAERAALLTVPKVLKRGKIIYEKDNHKGNGFPTVTIAAPVVINGKKVVVAAVVQKTGKNKYHAHRVLLPDGSVFVLEKTDAELSTASMLSIKAQQRLPNNSASSISIPQNPEMSTTKSDFSLENVSEEADRSADVANQQASDATKERKGVTTVEDVARDLSRYANVKSGTRKELLRKVSDLYSAMESGQITAEEQTEQLQQIADYLVANRKDPVIRRDEYMQEVLDTLKSSKVTLTDAQKAEVRSTYQNFNEWRSQMMGGVDIVNAGTKLDVLWDEWAEKFPNIFPDVTETDMPGELLRIYKTARDSQDAGDIASAELYDAQTEQIAAALPQMISDAFWSVGKKITPEYRKMLSAIAERDDARAEVKQKEREIEEGRREAQRELQAAEANAARERAKIEQESDRRLKAAEKDAKRREKEAKREALMEIKAADKNAANMQGVEDIARKLSDYAGMKRGTRNELELRLSRLYVDMENARITTEEIEERVWEITDFVVENIREIKMEDNGEPERIAEGARAGTDAGAEASAAHIERVAATLPKMITDGFWSIGKKISTEYRHLLSAISERDDARAEVKQKDRQIAQERREAQRELQAAEANAARERDQVEQEMTRRTNDIERLGKAVKSLNTKAKDNKTRLFSPAIYRSDVLKKVFSDLGGISASNVNSGTVRDRIADLYEWYSDEENNIFPEIMEKNPDTERVLMNISKGKGELTREEIKALTNVVTYFGTVADHLQTCVKNGERTDAMPLAEQFVKVAKESDEKTAAAIRSAKRMFGKNKQLNYWEQFGRPETVAKIADNFSDGFFTYIFGEAQIAEVKKDKLRIDLARDVEQYLSNDKKYLGRLEKGEITFRGESMTVAEAVQLYLLLGRDQAKVHLFLGGFELQHDDKRIKCAPLRQMEDEDVRGMKPEEIIDAAEDACKIARAELSALMTESDLEFAEMLRQKYNGAMKQAKIKGDVQKQGYSNVEAGEDYAPMRIAQKVETADLSYQALEKVDRYAFNKQVYQLANNALLIQPAHKVFATHAEELATYVEIRPVVESFNIMYNLDVNNNRRNPETIKSAVERKGGFTRRAAQYTKDLLKDLQGDRFKDTRASFINDIVGKLRETFALSTLALNVNSWGSQLSSYIAAGSELRMSDLMRAGIGLYGRAKTADNVINKYSTVAMIRSYEGYATKARTLIDKTTGLSNKLMGVTSALDRFVVRRLWKVCLLQTCGSISAAKNATAEQMQKAGELLDHVILKTQQNAMVTTRSAAMRSNSELTKGVSAFSADGMMQFAQGLESTLEVIALEKQKKEALKQAKTAEETKRILEEYNPKIKAAKKKAGMAIGSMMMSSVYLAAISMAWQYIRGKLDDEEKIGMNFLWTAIGNLFGGLPIVRDFYDIFAEGYEAEFFAYTAFNDLAKNTSTMVEMTFDILSGKEVTSQEIARNLRSTVFAAGTLFGLPFRNVSNMARAALGLIGIADESIPYKFDNVFYEQSYNKDLEKALLDGDDQMVDTIVGIMLDQDGGDMNEGTRRATAKLIKSGYEGILPRSIPETLTNAQDVEVELTKKQRQQFEKVYSAAYRAADDLVRMGYFKAASKDEQAYALKFIWSTYYALAKDTVLGEDSTKKNVLFAEAIPVERLALIVAQASAIKADVDKNGKAINGSRMHKIEALIESLHLSAAQKYMMMGYLGYTNKKGRELVERYIRTLGLSAAEQKELLEMSGYKD